MGRVGLVACQGFLVGGACICVLVSGTGSLLSSAMKCLVVSFGGVHGFGVALGSFFFNVQDFVPVLLEN